MSDEDENRRARALDLGMRSAEDDDTRDKSHHSAVERYLRLTCERCGTENEVLVPQGFRLIAAEEKLLTEAARERLVERV